MKKRDLKSLALMGIASGALIASQAGAEEMNINMETTLAAGCGGSGGCGGSTPPPQQTRRGSSSNYQPSGGGHSCGGQPRSNYNQQSPSNARQYNQGANYSQKNTRYSRQIAESDDAAPSSGDTTQPTKPEGQNGCSGSSGCSSKKPAQYRTRS